MCQMKLIKKYISIRTLNCFICLF